MHPIGIVERACLWQNASKRKRPLGVQCTRSRQRAVVSALSKLDLDEAWPKHWLCTVESERTSKFYTRPAFGYQSSY